MQDRAPPIRWYGVELRPILANHELPLAPNKCFYPGVVIPAIRRSEYGLLLEGENLETHFKLHQQVVV